MTTVTTARAKAKTTSEQLTSVKSEAKEVIEGLVSNLVTGNKKYSNAKKVVKEYETDYKALKEYSDAPADEPQVFETDEGTVTFGAESNKTEITDMEYIFNKLGKDVFLQLAKISVTDAKNYLTKPELDQCTTTRKSGSRSFKSAVKSK